MFPPQPTDELEPAVMGLFASLHRAGDQLVAGSINPSESEDCDATVSFRLHLELPRGAKRYVTRYIREYLKESGWYVHSVKHKKFQISFSVVRSPHLASERSQTESDRDQECD